MEFDAGSNLVSHMWPDGGPGVSPYLGAAAHQPAATSVSDMTSQDVSSSWHTASPPATKATNGGDRKSSSAPKPVLETDELNKFRALPALIQKPLIGYPSLVESAFLQYALSGDSKAALEVLVKGAPEFLHLTDSPTYRDSPLGVALLKKKPETSRFFISLARECSLERVVLSHRNTAGHTLLMLAVDLNSRDCADILTNLLKHDPTQIYRLYDSEGRNVFHNCVADGFAVSFRIILESVLKLSESVEISRQSIKSALDMTDRQQKTPIHYMAEFGDVEVFNVLDTFARSKSLLVDYDTRFKTSDSKTPLMTAIECGNYDVCKWLLEKGGVDVSKKHPASCFTALHFAARSGNAELIRLLRLHGALADYYDDECEKLDEYKTPLQIAESLEIADKARCLKYLTIDVEQLKTGYTYTIDSLPRSGATASLTSAAGARFSPANFLSKKKIVQDLQLFGSDRREELSRELAIAGKSRPFIEGLARYVPELSKNSEYLKDCPDPVFSAIVLLSDTEQASRFVIKQVLLDIDAVQLVELVIPATTS